MTVDRSAAIERLVSPALAAMGYDVVRVMLQGGHRPGLQIMIERRDLRPLGVDDCAEASRAVSAILDAEDPVGGAYVLEVSSPGIDRPLTRRQDYERFAGFEARLELREPVDGRRRFRGRLLGLDGDRVRLAIAGGETTLPLGEVTRAKLELTDELIAATAATPS